LQRGRLLGRSAADTARGTARLTDHPNVSVGYHGWNDAVFAINEAVTHDHTSETDVGVETAALEFRRVVGELVQARLVDSNGLDVATPRRSRVVQGSAYSYGPQRSERTKEYGFYASQTVNGVEIANAGVRVMVHRSGKVASIQVEGPIVEALDLDGTSVPSRSARTAAQTAVTPGCTVGDGYWVTRKVTEAELDARVHADNPGAKITPMGTIYYLSIGQTSAVVEPRQGYWVYRRRCGWRIAVLLHRHPWCVPLHSQRRWIGPRHTCAGAWTRVRYRLPTWLVHQRGTKSSSLKERTLPSRTWTRNGFPFTRSASGIVRQPLPGSSRAGP
jgi:hypothetical protein